MADTQRNDLHSPRALNDLVQITSFTLRFFLRRFLTLIRTFFF